MAKLLITLRVLLSCFIVIITLEFCVRVDEYFTEGAPFLGNHSIDSIFTSDSVGRRGIPDAQYRKWKLNKLGFRGPDLRQDTMRIICIGASETFGMYESTGKEFPRQLEEKLNLRGGARFEVINAAYPGQSFSTAIRRLPEYISLLKPKYAVLYVNPTTYAQPESKPPAPRTHDPEFELRITERFRDLAKSALPEFIQSRFRAHNDAEAEKMLRAYRGPNYDRIPEERILKFSSDLAKAVDTLRDGGVFPILVTHATRFGPRFEYKDPEMLLNWRRFDPALNENGFADLEFRTNGAVREIARSRSREVGLVDAAEEIPAGPAYFGDAVHFTDAGAEIMSRELAKAITDFELPSFPRGTVKSVALQGP